MADIAYEKTGNFASFAPLAPFLNAEKIGQYADIAYRENGIPAIVPLAPFISTEALNRMAKDALEKDGLAGWPRSYPSSTAKSWKILF